MKQNAFQIQKEIKCGIKSEIMSTPANVYHFEMSRLRQNFDSRFLSRQPSRGFFCAESVSWGSRWLPSTPWGPSKPSCLPNWACAASCCSWVKKLLCFWPHFYSHRSSSSRPEHWKIRAKVTNASLCLLPILPWVAYLTIVAMPMTVRSVMNMSPEVFVSVTQTSVAAVEVLEIPPMTPSSSNTSSSTSRKATSSGLRTWSEPGLLTNSIIFCWLFAIKDRCKIVCFRQTHNQGLRQLLLMVSWDLHAKRGTPDVVLVSL